MTKIAKCQTCNGKLFTAEILKPKRFFNEIAKIKLICAECGNPYTAPIEI